MIGTKLMPRLEILSQNAWISKYIQLHDDIPLINFSCGTFVSLNTFVKHYKPNSINSTTKISFEHDCKKIVVTYNDVDSDSLLSFISRQTLEMQIDYDSIFSITVDNKDKNKFDVYFLLKYPPIVLTKVSNVCYSN